MKKNKFIKFLVFIFIFVWWVVGWPVIWQNPRIPPKVQEAQAAVTSNSPSSNTGTAWTNPTNAYSDDTNLATITAGNPSGSNVWGTYGFSLANNTIDQVRIRYDAKSAGVASQSQTRRPTGDDSNTVAATKSTGTTFWGLVDEAVVDDADFYTMVTNAGGRVTMTSSAFTVPANSSITNLTVFYRANNAGAANVRASIKVNGVYYDTTDAGNDPSAMTTYSYAFTTNPNTGAAWTVADINGSGAAPFQAFGTSSTDCNPDNTVTWVYAVANYTEIDDQIKVDVSWDGGTSWSSTQNTTLTSTEATTFYDVTAATAWTPAKLANGQLQVRAIAQSVNTAEVVSLDWLPVEVTYTPFPAVDTPAYDNGTATYNNDVSVTITVANPASSVICYTTDGSTPAATTPGTCSTGTTYSGAVSITATGTVLKAIGTKVGYPNSAVQSATYTLTVGAITSSPGAGTYTSTQSVTLNIATTTSAVAHYTTDGSAVSCSSTTYFGAFNVSTTTTVKAIGCKTNYNSDTAISNLYTINIISISITSDGTVAYGTLTSGQNKSTIDLSDTQTAKNDGNVAENFNIKTDAPSGWSLGSASGSDTFVHEFSTNSGSAWTKFTTADSYQTLITNIAANGTQNFDLRFTAPNPSTSTTQKTITITIQAVAN